MKKILIIIIAALSVVTCKTVKDKVVAQTKKVKLIYDGGQVIEYTTNSKINKSIDYSYYKLKTNSMGRKTAVLLLPSSNFSMAKIAKLTKKKNVYLALEEVEESYPSNITQTDKDGNDTQVMISGAYKVHKTMTKEQMGF